ncbi:MAG TPA: transporter [Chitinophagales bacterium]|nr:transporter [Chitinophagales bacterium]
MKHFTLLITWLITMHAYAQELITDRPDFTESPYLVPINYLQFEQGFSYSGGTTQDAFDPTFEIDYNILQIASTLVRYTVGSMVELRLEFNPTVTTYDGESITGLPPIGLGVKTRIINGDGLIPQVAVLFTAYPGILATENMQPEVPHYVYRIAANHIITDWLSVGYNFGAVLSSINAPVYLYSLSAGIALGDKAGYYIEAYGDFSSEKFEGNFTDNLILDTGLTYAITPLLQADLFFGFGINSSTNYYKSGVGISYMFSLKKSDG